MSDANQRREEEQIKTFISVTGSDRDIARQYLEASVWDLNVRSLVLSVVGANQLTFPSRMLLLITMPVIMQNRITM